MGGGMDSQYKLLSELLSDQAAFITSPKTSLVNYWGALPPAPPPVSMGLCSYNFRLQRPPITGVTWPSQSLHKNKSEINPQRTTVEALIYWAAMKGALLKEGATCILT